MIETPADMLAHHASAEAVASFIDYRKKHKRAALSERGAMMLAKTLRDINASGGDASEALDIAQERGWQTIKLEWYWHDKNGNRGAQPSRADATTQAITFAGRACRTPGEDSF